MIIIYFLLSFSIVFCSFIVGMICTAMIKESKIYKNALSNLNLIRSEKLNKVLGVWVVRWMVRNTFFKNLNPTLKLDGKSTITDLQNIRNLMTKAEIDHLFAFCFVLLLVSIVIIEGYYAFAAILLLFNTVMNLYPSLLQQQNKRRIDKIITRYH